MKLITISDEELDKLRNQISRGHLPLAERTAMIQAINTVAMLGSDAYTLFQSGFSRGYIAGVNSSKQREVDTCRSIYDKIIIKQV